MDFSATVLRQRTFFHSGATRSLDFRRAQLQKLLSAIEAGQELLSEALFRDLHKSPHEAYLTEIGLVLSEVRNALRHVKRWMRPQRRSSALLAWPARGSICPEPYGVALILGPWNYPLQLLMLPLVGAIAAGNCAVLKPSEFAPHTARAIAQILNSAFPEDYIVVVQGETEAAQALLREQFDNIFFTGSSGVGRAVMAAAANHLTPVTLELGGKSPCIVCRDAPIELTARRIAWGKFMNAGQTCVAPDFVLADAAIRRPLVEAIKKVLVEFYGNDAQKSPSYGRIINRKHFDRLCSYLSQGTIACGGSQLAPELYLAPTLLTEVQSDAPVMQEEIFGPILPVLDFNNLDEALSLLRGRPIPLALYLFTRDPATQDRVLSQARSGGVCINDTVTHMIGKHLPFGGLGQSGVGAYHGRASFDAFTHYRSVLKRSLAIDLPLRYPPPRISLATLKRGFGYLLGG